MTKPRPPELEDSEQQVPSSQTANLITRLDKGRSKLHKEFGDSQLTKIASENSLRRILVVDDNPTFLSSLSQTADKLKLNLVTSTLLPENVDATRKLIIEAFNQQQAFDYVLLDYAYNNKEFNGLDILRTLRPEINSSHTQEDNNEIRLRYLPVAIVTRDGSEEQSQNPFDPDTLLGAGADKVYSEKGLNLGDLSTQDGNTHLSPRPLLTYLSTVGFKEMRSRAWARMWQDLRYQLEDNIKLQLDSNQWLKTEGIKVALENVWNTLANTIIQTGYASHVSMRTLHYLKQPQKWELRKVGSTDKVSCPDNVPWDALPILETCLTEENHSIYTKDQLVKSDLIKKTFKNDKEILAFESYIGCRAMYARLDSRTSSVGTFLMTRHKGQPPFSEEDKTLLRITLERLGLFYRELHMRRRHHSRQMALVRLGRELMDIEDENIIVAKAVKTLHIHLHILRGAFRKNPADDPAKKGRVSIRLIEPGTGRLMRPNHINSHYFQAPRWALGFDTEDSSPKVITLDSDSRYKKVIEAAKPQFLAEPKQKQIEDRRKNKTHAKMLSPILAGTVVVGTVNIEHQDNSFYGKEKDASADFALLQAVALEVGQALRALRARRMLIKLLQLQLSTGEKGKDQVIGDLMGILYDYTGCAVGMWLEPRHKKWKTSSVWECPQGNQSEAAPDRFRNDHKIKSWRFEQWQQHLEDDFQQTLINKVINEDKQNSENKIVYYQESNLLSGKAMMVNTLSQAVLILRDPTSKETLGVFSFLYNQKPGLDLKKQQPLLEDAAKFAANYLSIFKENRAFLFNSQVMQQQADLGLAYQQLRHSLKLQLGGLNSKLGRLVDDLEDNEINFDSTNALTKEIKGFLSNISHDIEISKSMLALPNVLKIDIKIVWNGLRQNLIDSSEGLENIIEKMEDSIFVYADEDTLELVFQNLCSNAIEAMSDYAGSKKLTCLLLNDAEQEVRNIAVRDTGPGLKLEVVEQLFEQIGISTKATGTGFGTYFSAYMLRRFGADICYDRQYSNGAQFILSFPFTQAKT